MSAALQPTALLIAYYFPPLGGIGTQRTLKFVRYLPAYGWQPHVLSVRRGVRGEPADPALCATLPAGVQVTRTGLLDLTLLPRAAARLGLQRLASLLRALLLFLPDQQLGWLPAALSPALRLARSCDVIYSTSAPYTGHLIGRWASQRSGRPWVADFRDEWTLNPFLRYPSPALLALNRVLERRVLQAATRVLVTSPGHAASFQSLLPRAERAKVQVIYNGYDPADYPAPAPDRHFRLVHTGSFYGLRQPATLLLALERLVQQGRIRPADLRLVLVGSSASPVQVPPALNGLVELPGFLPRPQALRLLAEASVALLIVGLQGAAGLDNIPGKLYDYLALGKPVLALADPRSASAQLVRAAGCGLVVPPHDVPALAELIGVLYEQWRSGGIQLAPNAAFIQQFDSRHLTRQLAALFDEVAR